MILEKMWCPYKYYMIQMICKKTINALNYVRQIKFKINGSHPMYKKDEKFILIDLENINVILYNKQIKLLIKTI